MAKCGNEPKANGPDKGTIRLDETMCQSAGKVSEIDCSWLACAIESEGSIQLTWGKRTDGYIQLVPRVNLVNQSVEYLENALRIAGGNFNRKHSQGTYSVVWYGMKRVQRVLELIRPHMVIARKIEIAEKLNEFINYRLSVNPHICYGEKERDLFLAIRELNGKGRVHPQELRFRFEKSSTTIRRASEKE